MSKENKIVMNVKELIRLTAEETGKTQKELGEILKAFDSVIIRQLAVATPETDVEVKILPSGVSLISEYVGSHAARNPRTGETIQTVSKNRVKGKIYGTFKKAINGDTEAEV